MNALSLPGRAFALALVVLFALFASQTLAAVGRTPGEVLVTANGAGTYRIPLSLPPGTHGLAPELALIYDHTSGNGLLGMGWNITGLQAITRCPKNMAQDQGVITALNLTTADRFCFNGNRLRLTSGTYGAATGSTAVREWALNRIRDRSDNYVFGGATLRVGTPKAPDPW